ncbi:hypothetical protein [Nocardia asteroides]|uniref:hypothetical protein n=1 Tax=Nocardia asteroides TaxID=1824 RepID=UPI001E4D83F5|nr:hypothetical protein [Nocardia asteroides]UGT58831.1 hypothetical protein LTT85_33305 [Nocardia asteroides]
MIITPLSMIEISAVEQALADHAGTYFHPGPMGFIDAAHGVLADHLGELAAARGTSAVYAVITDQLKQQPSLLTMTAEERRRRRELRASRARRTLATAEQHYFQGDYVLASELVDRAACTDYATDGENLRGRINTTVAGLGQPTHGQIPTPGDAGLCLWKLLAKTARLRPDESSSTAERTLERLQDRNTIVLDDDERRALTSLTNFYATDALNTILRDGPADPEPTEPGAAAMLRARDDAVEAWRRMGIPRGPIADHSLALAARAADAAMTWAILALGYVEAHRRLASLTPLPATTS